MSKAEIINEIMMCIPYILVLNLLSNFIIYGKNILYKIDAILEFIFTNLTFFKICLIFYVIIASSVMEEFIFRFVIKEFLISNSSHEYELKLFFSFIFGLTHMCNYLLSKDVFVICIHVLITSVLGYILYNCTYYNSCIIIHLCYNVPIMSYVIFRYLKDMIYTEKNDKYADCNNDKPEVTLFMSRRNSFSGICTDKLIKNDRALKISYDEDVCRYDKQLYEFINNNNIDTCQSTYI